MTDTDTRAAWANFFAAVALGFWILVVSWVNVNQDRRILALETALAALRSAEIGDAPETGDTT